MLLGLAVLMKQHAVFFPALGIVLILWRNLRRTPRDLRAVLQRVVFVALGGASPLLLLIALFAAQGVLGRFWFWTFQYARVYVSQVSWSDAPLALRYGWRAITPAMLPFWLLAGAGIIGLWVGRWTSDVRFFLSALLVASFLAICPGFFFREHYFIVLLPSVALFCGVAVVWLERAGSVVAGPRGGRLFAAAVFAVLAASYVAEERVYLFSMPPRELSRIRYGQSPFAAAIEIARYIREHTERDERIAVLGSEPEIYFYADRKSATGYLYAYPLMENQKYSAAMQNEMIQQIEAAHPKYLVFAQIGTSWLVRPESDKRILSWASIYITKCYELVGIADIDSMGEAHYAWDGALDRYKTLGNQMYTFRRDSDGPCVAGSYDVGETLPFATTSARPVAEEGTPAGVSRN
jgi:hypothetical protein